MFAKGTWSRTFLKVAGGTSIVGAVAAGGIYRQRLKGNKAITAEDFNEKQYRQDLIPALEALKARGSWAGRKEEPPLPGSAGNSLPPMKLYSFTTCPFCCIAKAFLDYHKIPYESVEVEPMFKSQLDQIEYKKVPSLQFITTGHWGPFIADSELIVSKIASILSPQTKKELEDKDIGKWREFARQELVRVLVVNINSSLSEAWRGYDYIDNFDSIPYVNKVFLKAMGAPVMYLVAKLKTKPSLIESGILKESDDINKKLLEKVNLFTEQGCKIPLGSNKEYTDALLLRDATAAKAPQTIVKFHGGSVPDLADLDVYGVFQSVRGHRLYDDIILHTDIGPWLDKMDVMTGKDKYVVGSL